MVKVTSTFYIRRYWFDPKTPADVLATLNYRWGNLRSTEKNPYVDIHYINEENKLMTMMELKCSEWIVRREELNYILEGDDGL
jgi:hypothetical protein